LRNAKEYSWYSAKTEAKAGSACSNSYPASPVSRPGTNSVYSSRAISGAELCTIRRANGILVLNASYANECRAICRTCGSHSHDASCIDECGTIRRTDGTLSAASTWYAATNGAADTACGGVDAAAINAYGNSRYATCAEQRSLACLYKHTFY